MKKRVFFGLIGLFIISGCCTAKTAMSGASENKESTSGAQEAHAVNPASLALIPASTPGNAEIVANEAKTAVMAQDMKKTQVQEALKKAGYYDGEIDGKFGAQTKAAVKKFQEAEGLKVDGIAGPATKEKLLKYIS